MSLNSNQPFDMHQSFIVVFDIVQTSVRYVC